MRGGEQSLNVPVTSRPGGKEEALCFFVSSTALQVSGGQSGLSVC